VEVAENMRASLVLFAAVVLGAAGCGGGTKTVTETATVVQTTTVRVTTQESPSSATACTGDAMSGSFAVIPGSPGAGQISYRLRVKNDSPVACNVSGLPNVQLLDPAGHDLPTNAQPAQPGQATAARIILQPGASAVAEARFSPDVPGGSEQTDGPCEPKAYTLRVSFAGAPLDVPVTPPTPVCERGTLSFSLFSAG
jgi:Protein of unknown function (DUF4232)